MAPILFEVVLDAVLDRTLPESQAISKFQSVERDIAVIVQESVSHDRVLQVVREAATAMDLVRQAVVFDVYRPKQAGAGLQNGEKSLAARLTLNSDAATLTDEQIEAAVQAVIVALQQHLGARLRA